MPEANFDLVIRNGTIIDGTGAPGFPGDLAIANGRIAAVGSFEGTGREEFDATGRIVTPGFIDIHTHYDGQFTWDDTLDPSFSNGVTTCIAGNCGVGFAPALPEHRQRLVEMMEGVEDIPGIVLDEGLDWNWQTFPEYLDRLDGHSYSMDIATHLAHAPLRVAVMGDRALRHEAATEDDIAAMCAIVREAMDAGAIGVSGSRILEHKSSRGEHVPGTFAEDTELIAIARAMGETGRGVFQIVPLGASGDTMGTQIPVEERFDEHARFERLAAACGRPVTYLLHAFNHEPDEFRQLMAMSAEARERGLDVRPQVAARGVGLLLPLDGYHIFRCRPSYLEISHLPVAERAAAMRDPVRRARILSEADVDVSDAPSPRIFGLAQRFSKVLDRFYILNDPPNYEPGPDAKLSAVASATDRSMEEALYDVFASGDGGNMVVDFASNYTGGNLDAAYEMLADPGSVSGLGDGGAHLQLVCDAAMTTFLLTFWARDRVRGPRFNVEAMVHKLTGQAADLYGLRDRGSIEAGLRADINVIDFQNLRNGPPSMVYDLPLGGARLLQPAQGYCLTIVNGVVTRRNDTDTGARPGRLIRHTTG